MEREDTVRQRWSPSLDRTYTCHSVEVQRRNTQQVSKYRLQHKGLKFVDSCLIAVRETTADQLFLLF